jgi:hypothetical protein
MKRTAWLQNNEKEPERSRKQSRNAKNEIIMSYEDIIEAQKRQKEKRQLEPENGRVHPRPQDNEGEMATVTAFTIRIYYIKR